VPTAETHLQLESSRVAAWCFSPLTDKCYSTYLPNGLKNAKILNFRSMNGLSNNKLGAKTSKFQTKLEQKHFQQPFLSRNAQNSNVCEWITKPFTKVDAYFIIGIGFWQPKYSWKNRK